MGKYLVMGLMPTNDRDRITDADDPAVAIVKVEDLRKYWRARMGIFKELIDSEEIVALHFACPFLFVASMLTVVEEWLDELDGVTSFFEVDTLPGGMEEAGADRTMIVTEKGIMFEVGVTAASLRFRTPLLTAKVIKPEEYRD